MFTYALPDLIALIAAAKLDTPGALANCFEVSLPLFGSLQGFAQMLMITGPAWPALPEWTCAARAGPVTPVACSVEVIDLLCEATVKTAEPVAFELLFGVSDL